MVIERGLLAKGFMRRDPHHRFYRYFTLDGKQSNVVTFVSHSAREVSDHLVAKMAKQCRLNKRQFLNLVKCPLGRDAYENILVSLGVIDGPDHA